jgi:hypothetical protein
LVEQAHREADSINMKDIVLPVPFYNTKIAELSDGTTVWLDADILDPFFFVVWSMCAIRSEIGAFIHLFQCFRI